MRLIFAVVFFYIFWYGINHDKTWLAYTGLAASVFMIIWEMFDEWFFVAGVFY